jgi:hypothetical protein
MKGVQVVQEVEGISVQGPGEEEMKDQQRVDPELIQEKPPPRLSVP